MCCLAGRADGYTAQRRLGRRIRVGAEIPWPRLATFSREAVVEYLDIAERGYQRAPNHRRHRGKGIHCGVGHRAAAALFTGWAFAGLPKCSHLHLTAHERVSVGGKCGAGDSGDEVGSPASP